MISSYIWVAPEAFVVVVGILIVAAVLRSAILLGVVLITVVFLLVLYRRPVQSESYSQGVLSPCDGIIKNIECIDEERVRITIRTSIFDACVVRLPVSGNIVHVGADLMEVDTPIGIMGLTIVPHKYGEVAKLVEEGSVVSQGYDVAIIKWSLRSMVSLTMPKHAITEKVMIGERVRVGDPIADIASEWI
jgi:hypothetical protein